MAECRCCVITNSVLFTILALALLWVVFYYSGWWWSLKCLGGDLRSLQDLAVSPHHLQDLCCPSWNRSLSCSRWNLQSKYFALHYNLSTKYYLRSRILLFDIWKLNSFQERVLQKWSRPVFMLNYWIFITIDPCNTAWNIQWKCRERWKWLGVVYNVAVADCSLSTYTSFLFW